jgi:hypothetical protein
MFTHQPASMLLPMIVSRQRFLERLCYTTNAFPSSKHASFKPVFWLWESCWRSESGHARQGCKCCHEKNAKEDEPFQERDALQKARLPVIGNLATTTRVRPGRWSL